MRVNEHTARAHRAGKTRDWVVLYSDNGLGESRHTVITAAFGPLSGRRVVAGRENECLAAYAPGHRQSATRDVVLRQSRLAEPAPMCETRADHENETGRR